MIVWLWVVLALLVGCLIFELWEEMRRRRTGYYHSWHPRDGD